ncbi:TetR/AcrR family transcriptional regulator [Pseudorhizobium marinum]|uniref:TetR/AcrR family transcriptional regulator n=1 Tax=Pseudorhizobium marinum TaxID=1496690 RepID=UPI00049693EB|nr:TetR/AcrR family transcriptional regulator [Pseudorhizobium marinum]
MENNTVSPPATRQRRPPFDREKGVEIAKSLFHARGYDAVSIADLTQALEINPPSLYAAYGSKLALFERAMRSYRSTDFLQIEKILRPGRLPAEALTDLMIAAARHYTKDRDKRGCMITEALQGDDEQACTLAGELAREPRERIRNYIAAHAPKSEVDRISDYLLLNLRGLSAYARLGYTQKKLIDCARTAGRALEREFAHPSPA